MKNRAGREQRPAKAILKDKDIQDAVMAGKEKPKPKGDKPARKR